MQVLPVVLYHHSGEYQKTASQLSIPISLPTHSDVIKNQLKSMITFSSSEIMLLN